MLFASHYRPWIHRWVRRTRRSVAVLITTPTTPLSYLEQRDEVSFRNWYTRWTSVHRSSAAFNIPTRERRIKSRANPINLVDLLSTTRFTVDQLAIFWEESFCFFSIFRWSDASVVSSIIKTIRLYATKESWKEFVRWNWRRREGARDLGDLCDLSVFANCSWTIGGGKRSRQR